MATKKNYKKFERESSHLKGYSYDTQNQRLFIQFNTGAEWVYNRVPAEVVAGLLTAESHGAYFAANIKKNEDYPSNKL